jgi:hypothetical protein
MDPIPYSPRGSTRLIVYYDELGLQRPAVPLVQSDPGNPEAWRRAIESLVHVHADAGVDALSKVIWSRFTHLLHPSVSAVMIPSYAPRPVDDEHSEATVELSELHKALHEAGEDMIQIMIDQARRDGIRFIAALRMNDRHPIAVRERFWLDHPEWRLDLGRKGPYWEGGLDYAHDEIRESILEFIAAMLDRYDVDGIEFDWMRWVHVFRPGTQRESAPVLTAFHDRARKLLDNAGKSRGRRLLLGSRVPMNAAACLDFGFDVQSWLDRGLLDYIVPSHFGNMDFNAEVEAFRKLTEEKNCKVYPSLHGQGWTGPCRLEEYRKEHYYAAATNWYAFGADGLQVYNYQFKTFDEIRTRIPELAPIADPDRLARCNADYLYWQDLGKVVAGNEETMRYDVIHLDRSQPAPHGSFAFRLAVDGIASGTEAMLEFKTTGLHDDDRLDISINGEAAPAESIRRTYVFDGSIPGPQQKFTGPGGDFHWINPPVPAPYHLFEVPLSSPPIQFGGNQLSVALGTPAGSSGVVSVEEVKVLIRTRDAI